jgi:hypothetical protein
MFGVVGEVVGYRGLSVGNLREEAVAGSLDGGTQVFVDLDGYLVAGLHQ